MRKTMSAVCCRGLTKGFGAGDARVSALRGVDLDVRAGELTMLVGPSGCGKTTLISIMGAMLEADGGSCDVFGRDLGTLGPRERARFRAATLGFVFQAFNLIPALTAGENVCVPLLIQGVPRDIARERARSMLEDVGLGDRVDALPARLSGGQQQRVAIARALVHQPPLVLCDEPTSNLDAQAGHDVLELLRKVGRAAQRSLIVVTHDPRIHVFADRIVRMEDGKVVDDKPAEAGLDS